MANLLTIPCDSGLQKQLTVNDKYVDYLVFKAESDNGQTGQEVSVVVSRHYAALLRDQLNKFLEV